MKSKKPTELHDRIREIIESARAGAARSVNTAQVVSNWLIGREIIEEEQQGRQRADYGDRLMQALAERLRQEYGPGYGLANLKLFKQFYLAYGTLVGPQKGDAGRSLSETPEAMAMPHAAIAKSWIPGLLHPNLRPFPF